MEKFSYANSKRVANFRYVTIPSLLEQVAREVPNKTAIIIRNLRNDGDGRPYVSRETLTFLDLAENSLSLAASLLALGIKPGDKIAIIGSCSPEYLYLEYACQRISVLMMRIPVTLASSDFVIDVLKKYKVKALVVENGNIEANISSMIPGLFAESNDSINAKYDISNLEHYFYLREDGTERGQKWKSIRELGNDAGDRSLVQNIQDSQSPDDPAVVFPTSGSTGFPKFVVHSHFSFINGMTELAEHCFNVHDPSFIYMSDRPPSWMFGLTMMSSFLRSTTVFLDPTITREQNGLELYLDVVKEERVTDTLCLVYILYDMMKAVEKGQIQIPTSLQNILTGGELVPQEILEFSRRSFNIVSLAYGTTETGLNSLAVITEEAMTGMEPFPSTEFKITSDSGRLLPRDTVGNIYIRNTSKMLGYLEDAAATDLVLSRDGWYSTGDVGIINGDGELKVAGRSKEVISKGGNKIYPLQVETILQKHPGVLKVIAIAVPDPRLFNEVCVCIIPKDGEPITEADLRSFCETQFLASYALALPKYYLIMQEYPSISSGKVDKNVLREMAICKFNLK